MSKNFFARVFTAQPHHVDGVIITVEVDITNGLHSFTIVGLGDKAIDEARDRVGSALKNANLQSPKKTNHKTTISLAPAELRKAGSYFDLALAVGYLKATQQIFCETDSSVFLGELGLNGDVRPIKGVLALAWAAKQSGFTEIYVPAQNAKEAAFVKGIDVYGVKNLRSLVDHFIISDALIQTPQIVTQEEKQKVLPKQEPLDISKLSKSIAKALSPDLHGIPDFIDVRGQEAAKRGLLIAATGGHNVSMYGPPGTGKTMMAKACAGILPPLSNEKALEVTGIHSIAGVLKGSIVLTPPFRSPHHTASHVSIIGGGTHPRPGEITLAHNGILFLDEFPEFDKRVIEALRQPLEDKKVHISRAQSTAVFPANVMLVASLNPCPCGFLGSGVQECTCTHSMRARYKNKISGPIMDRIDMWLPVEHIEYEKLDALQENQESSDKLRRRVVVGRERQYKRNGGRLNALLGAKEIHKLELSDEARMTLRESAKTLGLSPRSYHRMIKLARTIADLDQRIDHSETIQTEHILEAFQYRPKL